MYFIDKLTSGLDECSIKYTNPKAMIPMMEKVLTSSALIIIDNDVVKTYTNPDMEYDDQAAIENVEAIWEQVKDRRIFNLIVSDPTTHVTVEARGYTHNEFEKLKVAEAIVIKTLGHRILANYYAQAKPRKTIFS